MPFHSNGSRTLEKREYPRPRRAMSLQLYEVIPLDHKPPRRVQNLCVVPSKLMNIFTAIPAPIAAVDAIAQDRDGAIWITRSHMRNFTGPICKVTGDHEQCYGKSYGFSPLPPVPSRLTRKGGFGLGRMAV
jgi:hypothetical protein